MTEAVLVKYVKTSVSVRLATKNNHMHAGYVLTRSKSYKLDYSSNCSSFLMLEQSFFIQNYFFSLHSFLLFCINSYVCHESSYISKYLCDKFPSKTAWTVCHLVDYMVLWKFMEVTLAPLNMYWNNYSYSSTRKRRIFMGLNLTNPKTWSLKYPKSFGANR